jgi:phosphoglycerate kinase
MAAAFRTLDDLEVANKRVLVRADLNVPMQDGKITDATRIERVAATIAELADKKAKVIVLSHFGRPKGRDPKQSLKPLAPALGAAMGGRKVAFADDCVGPDAEKAVAALKPGEVLLLENTRFHDGEEKNDPAFAKALAALGDIYVNDAFSAAHRAHASTEGLAHLLPAAAGRLMQAELEALESALGNPKRPVMAIVGGAKVSTKLAVLTHLIEKVDVLVIGGAMANTFLLALGASVGTSLVERDLVAKAREVMARAEEKGCEIALPTDAVIAKTLEADAPHEGVPVTAVPDGWMILDVGPATAAGIADRLESCKTLVWNGPLGAFETKPFDESTLAVAHAAAQLTQDGDLVSVAGGGDTVAALAEAGVEDALTYVSAAGGAFLEWMEGRELPGVAALQKAGR